MATATSMCWRSAKGRPENATVVKELLEDMVARGVNPDQKRLFVIDGSKALRTAINAVFGSQHPVQRCRAHKLRKDRKSTRLNSSHSSISYAVFCLKKKT